MSKLKNILEITPPSFGGVNKGEVFTSHGHICSYCNGYGHFQPTQVGHDEYEQNLCPICKGSGKLQVKIVVGWIPEKEIRNCVS